MTKLHEIEVKDIGPCILGACGALPCIELWKQTLENEGICQVDVPDNESGELTMEGILLTKTGEAYYVNTSGHYYKVNFPMTLGSGCVAAAATIMKGGSALEACRDAILVDVCCGGDIHVYDMKKDKIKRYKT